MKKKCVFVWCMCIIVFSAQAQKLQGKLDFLKGEKQLNIVFSYEGMTIDGKAEKAYVENQVKDKPETEAQQWQENWYHKFRTEIYQAEFLKFFNDMLKDRSLEGGNFENAAYTAIVKIEDIDPGNFAGPFSNPSKLRGVVTFVKTGTTETVATIPFKKFGGNAFHAVVENRIGSSFGYLGKVIGGIVVKNLK